MSKLLFSLQSLFTRHQRFSTFSLGGLMVFVFLIMGVVSLTSLNDKAMKGYLLNKLETERQNLVEDGEVTDMLMLRARSMDTITLKSTGMIMPSREDITYVLPITVVAQNEY